jgi:hypothetical protein
MDYLIKAVIFTAYMSSVYFTVDFMINTLKSFIVDFSVNISAMMCQFGVFTGLNLYIAIIIAGFLFKKTLAFWR